MKNFWLHQKSVEIQNSILLGIRGGYPGHLIFPLSFAFLTDILTRDPILFYIYLSISLCNSTLHFLCGSFPTQIKKAIGDHGWSLIYLVTLVGEALSFLPPVFFTSITYGFWKPETIYAVLVSVIALEGFSKYSYAYFEGFLISTATLMLPMIVVFPFMGFEGLLVAIFAFGYYAVVIRHALTASRQLHDLFKEQNLTKTNQKRLQELLDVLPLKVILLSHDKIIKMANRRFTANYKSAPEIEQIKLHWYQQTDTELKSIIEKFLNSNIEESQFEFLTNFGRGKRWYLILLKKMKFDSLENEQNIVLAALDIQTEKEMNVAIEEEKIKQINSSRLASLGELAGGIAHEINNPLAIIMGNTDYLLKKLKNNELDQEQISYKLEKIHQVSLRIQKIITSMRNLIRTDNNTTEEQFSIKELVEDALGLCQEKFRVNGVELEVSYFDENSKARGNIQQIGQIMINLLNNAHDIVIDLPLKKVKIETQKDETMIKIRVKDSGPGVTDPTKLFQPFYTTKPLGRGTGLGLSLSQEFARKNNGDLKYYRIDEETVFEIILKAA